MPLDILFAQLVEFWGALKVTSGFTCIFKLPGKHNHAINFSCDIAILSQLCWKYVSSTCEALMTSSSLSHLEWIRTHHLCFTATETIQCTVNCNHWSQREFSVYLKSNSTFSKAEGLAVELGISQEQRKMKRWGGHAEGATAFSERLKSVCPILISRGVWMLFLIWLVGLGQVALCSDLGMLHRGS